jgi:hypothetical protein
MRFTIETTLISSDLTLIRKEVTKGTEVRAGNTESFDFEFSNFEHAPNSEFRVRAIATLDNQKNCRRAPCTVRERSVRAEYS